MQSAGLSTLRIYLCAAMALAMTALPVAADVPIASKGEAHATIVLPSDPDSLEQQAADELVEHIQLVTGAELSVANGQAPAGSLPIYLGRAADEELDAATREAGENRSAFTVRVTDDRIDIRGLTSEGTLYGAYELLEQVGVRWYMPGEIGRVLPEGDSIAFAEQVTTQTPDMVYRELQHIDLRVPWARRARLGGDERSTGQHGIPGLPRTKEAFEADPELFSLINGERRARQDCLSNPKALTQVVEHLREYLKENPDEKYIGMSSHDGGGYCQCEDCKALDQGVYDPTADRESMTDRYIWFFNRVLEELEDEHPDLHIVTYTYGAHMMPPAIDAHPRIVPVFAPITVDRIRGMDNPMSPDRHLVRWLIDEWSDRGVEEMYYRGYYHNLADPQFPMSQIDRIRHETPVFYEKGIRVMRVENIHTAWSSSFLDLYLATRMMWDVDRDVDALLNEFYAKFYGPAEAPMKQYHEGLDKAFTDTPYYTGGAFVYLPIFLDQPRYEELRNLLDEAASAAGNGNVYAERIAAVRLNWDRFEAWLEMVDSRNNHDFEAAHAAMERYYELSDKGADTVLETGALRSYTDPRLVFARERSSYSGSYFNRFWRDATVDGYHRTVEAGKLVAPLDDEWLFFLDAAGSGEIMGMHRPGELGGIWTPMKTSSRSWSDQGLHFYKGVGWYRQKVTIPAEYEGKPIYLWIGGVDERAQVWVNGHDLGISNEAQKGVPGVPGTFRPFDRDATEAVKFGEDNWVVVKVTNTYLNELGTGGIVAPVMFWTPNDPNWTPEEE